MGGVYRKLISVFCLYSFESWRKEGSRSALGLGFGREREREGTRIRQNSVRIKGKGENVQKRRHSTVHSLQFTVYTAVVVWWEERGDHGGAVRLGPF